MLFNPDKQFVQLVQHDLIQYNSSDEVRGTSVLV